MNWLIHKLRVKISMFFLVIPLFLKAQDSEKTFADRWEFIGRAVEEPGYTVWGTSPIMGEDGKVHLFVARWPCELKVDPGWRTHSEIAHYIGDKPEGPFVFSDVAVHYGPANREYSKFERPQVLLIDGSPAYLYVGSGHNIYGGDCTVSYVLRFKQD